VNYFKVFWIWDWTKATWRRVANWDNYFPRGPKYQSTLTDDCRLPTVPWHPATAICHPMSATSSSRISFPRLYNRKGYIETAPR